MAKKKEEIWWCIKSKRGRLLAWSARKAKSECRLLRSEIGATIIQIAVREVKP